VTACHNLLAMEHCGIKYSRIYVGSWSAWSSYDDTNINRGVTIENEN
jgi:thiosulfate/3-mercaptopyruvate sulfurtransferase